MGVSALLRAGSYVDPWHQFALAIISNSMGDRPVYFASSGNAAQQLGLGPFLVREGVAYRVNPGLPDPDTMDNIVELEISPFSGVTGIWLNEERTRTLAWEVFMHRDGLPEGAVRLEQREAGLPGDPAEGGVQLAATRLAIGSSDQDPDDRAQQVVASEGRESLLPSAARRRSASARRQRR